MKQITSLFIAMFALITSSFANAPEVSKPVLYAFNKSFAQAKEVAWTEVETFYKASFDLNGKAVTAFYSHEGELLAVTRNIATNELPQNLQTALKNETGNRWMTEMFMVTTLRGTAYYAVLENADSKLVLQSRNKKWGVYQVEEKQ